MSQSVVLLLRIIGIRNNCFTILVSPETIQINQNVDNRMAVSTKIIDKNMKKLHSKCNPTFNWVDQSDLTQFNIIVLLLYTILVNQS